MSLASLLFLALEATSMASPRTAIQKPVPMTAALPPRPSTPATPVLLEIRGPIPEDFRDDPRDRFPALEGRNGKDLGFWASRSNSSEKQDWKEFWWRQLSRRRDLALRGWALFGDPASQYLEEVKNAVLASQPALREQIRVYACPSPYVNALEMADGLVLVNAVAPSIMDTPANRQDMPKADLSAWPKVEEVAATILFLASPENRVTRGAVVPVYGKA